MTPRLPVMLIALTGGSAAAQDSVRRSGEAVLVIPPEVRGPLIAILMICFAFGALGGVVAHYINNEKTFDQSGVRNDSNRIESVNWYEFPSIYQSACIGIAGSLGFLFFITAVGGVSTTFGGLQEYLRAISGSVIAGFGARSLLPKMAGQLEKRVAEATSMAEAAIHDAKGAIHDAKEAIHDVKEVVHDAKEVVYDGKAQEVRLRRMETHLKLVAATHPRASAAEREEAIRRGQEIIEGGTDTSATWVNIARVYRAAGNLDKAIEVLSEAIKKMLDGTLENTNLGAAYYNRGCYKALIFKDCNDEKQLPSAIDDLKLFLSKAENRIKEIDDLMSDDDWNHLAHQDAFIAVVGRRHLRCRRSSQARFRSAWSISFVPPHPRGFSGPVKHNPSRGLNTKFTCVCMVLMPGRI